MKRSLKTKRTGREASHRQAAAALTALVVAQGATTVVAQTNAAPRSDLPLPSTTNASHSTTHLPEVVVQGQQDPGFKSEALSSPRFTEPLRNLPQTITVVPQAVIESRGASTLRDVLRNVPGISMQAGEGGGGLPGDNLSIRGFNARGDIFIDGVRDYGAYSRDPFNIEQVEVFKGPTSASAGRGSTGGSVNLVSKSPQLDPFYAGSLGFGTDEYKRLTADLNQPIDKLPVKGSALRFNALWHDAGVPGRDVVEESRWAAAPSFSMGLDTPTRVTLSYFHMEQDNIPDYGIPWVPAGNTNAVLSRHVNKAPPVDFNNFYGIKHYDFEDVVGRLGTAIVEHDFSSNISLRNLSRYGDTDRSSAITAPRFADLNPGAPVESDRLINRQLQRRDLENRIFANVTDAKIEFPTGPVEHAVVGGFEVSHEDQGNRNSAQTFNQPQTDIFNPTPNDRPLGPMPNNVGLPNDVTALTLAPYLFDTIKFSQQWEVNGGLRYDHVDADYHTALTNLTRVDDLLSWRAGIVFKPRPNGSIYFGAGSSFNPSIEGTTGLTLATNTVNLEPEETRTYELGTKWDLLKQRLLLTTAIFHTEKINARTAGINPGDPSIVLDGKQIVRGVEVGAVGAITREWQVFAGYTYLHTDVEASNTAGEEGAQFSNAPEHSANLWTTYRLPWNLEIGGGAQYVGSRLNNLSSNANVREAPDYWLFDAMLGFQATKQLTLRLNVYNLADEEYIDRVGGGHFVPGPGRSAILTASVKF